MTLGDLARVRASCSQVSMLQGESEATVVGSTRGSLDAQFENSARTSPCRGNRHQLPGAFVCVSALFRIVCYNHVSCFTLELWGRMAFSVRSPFFG